MQREVGENICEYHIFDMGDYESKIPPELKRVHYHRWGFMRQGGKAPATTQFKIENNNSYKGLKDTIRALGHDKLDGIDIFVSGINMVVFAHLRRLTSNIISL